MGEQRNAYMLLVGKPERKRPLGRPNVGGWIILRWVLKISDGIVWTGLVWLRTRTSGKLL
jgi:hypothetical protein